MLLGKRNTVDAELADLTSISEVMSLILRGNQPSHVGTISAKCNDRHDLWLIDIERIDDVENKWVHW